MTEPNDRSAPRLGRTVSILLLACYTAFVCSMTVGPQTPGDGALTRIVKDVLATLHEQGTLLWVDFLTVEFVGNVLLFVPLGLLTALVLDRRHRWLLLVVGTAFSGLIELTQLLFLAERYPDWRDLVSNTIGFLLGAGLGVLIRSRTRVGV
jgi:glycopeptide antibiotics resistance protein